VSGSTSAPPPIHTGDDLVPWLLEAESTEDLRGARDSRRS
jgi:hypothetical protein